MPQRTLCCLCISTCSQFECLFDNNGQLNGVYEIAVKYFDPMILTPVNCDKTIVICIECWQHIRDFYSFQQTVIQNQYQLKTSKHIENLPVPMVQTPPIKDEISITENPISVFDIVQIQNVATPEATPTTTLDTDYDVVIKDQSIVLQISSNIEPITSLDEVCERHLQETTKINDATDNCFEKLNCDICGDIFPNNYLLLEHYRAHHDNSDNIEIDQTESNSCVEITDNDADNNLLNTEQMDSNSYVEISDDDDENDNRIEIDDDITDINAYILQQRSLNKSNETLTESDHITPKALNSFHRTQLIYDKFIAKWNPNLKCPLCESKFKKYSKYAEHFRNEHPTEKCFIMCCQRKFFHRYVLVEHISVHLNPNIFKCFICGSKVTRKGSLKRHFQLQHTNELTRVQIEQMFQDKSIYSTPDDIINDTPDEVLNDIHNRKPSNTLANDTRTASTEQQSQLLAKVPTPPMIGNLSSAVSSECFSPKGEQHVAQAQLLQQKRKFTCNLCYASFRYNGNLIRHMKNQHKYQIFTEGEHNNYLGLDPISSNSSEIKSKNDEKGIITSTVSTNDTQIHEIISKTPNNVENTTNNGDIACCNDIRMPAVDIVNAKDEIPLNSHNESASNNFIIIN